MTRIRSLVFPDNVFQMLFRYFHQSRMTTLNKLRNNFGFYLLRQPFARFHKASILYCIRKHKVLLILWYYHIAINTTHYELLVKADGSWQVLGQTQCECSPGYIPSLKTGLCTGLLMDLFWHFTKRFTWTKWKLSHIPLSHFVMNIMIMNFHIYF